MTRRHGLPVLYAGLVAVLLVGCAPSSALETTVPSTPGPAPTVAGTPDARPSAAPGAPPAVPGAPPAVPVYDATAPAQAPEVAPVRLAVPSRRIDMAVVPVGVAGDGTMQLSEDAFEAGWYQYGPAPGDAAGNAILAAHVDSVQSGIGPFARLRDVRPGASVVVTDADAHVHRYRVVSVQKIDKDGAPTAAWFSRDGAPRLLLVTCGGAWDAKIRHYADNVVVTAEPTGG